MRELLIYGAYGYTGELVARRAVEQGATPVLAGRRPAPLAALARDLDLEARPVSLEQPEALDAALDGIRVVLHCAGPFSRTSRPMVDACLQRGVHYLDVTGEIDVFEAAAARDAEAREAGVMLLPGAGMDVVPSDCLAAHVSERLAGADRLELAFQGAGVGVSRGTGFTVLENLARGNVVRRDGQLVTLRTGERHREVDFGSGAVPVVGIPWGDVSTAWWSTRVPDIDVYLALPRAMALGLRAAGYLAPLAGLEPVQQALRSLASRRPVGPTAAERARASMIFWAQATAPGGRRATARLRTPGPYTLTVEAALVIARRVLAGDAPPGFQTPSTAYGKELAFGLARVELTDLD